jgi:hypothetical protein
MLFIPITEERKYQYNRYAAAHKGTQGHAFYRLRAVTENRVCCLLAKQLLTGCGLVTAFVLNVDMKYFK